MTFGGGVQKCVLERLGLFRTNSGTTSIYSARPFPVGPPAKPFPVGPPSAPGPRIPLDRRPICPATF